MYRLAYTSDSLVHLCNLLLEEAFGFPSRVVADVARALKRSAKHNFDFTRITSDFPIPTEVTPRCISVSGAPFGGKTTFLQHLIRTRKSGYVYIPEVIALMRASGQPFNGDPFGQRIIVALKYLLEVFSLKHYPNCLILCDRGVLDGAAYWPIKGSFESVVGKNEDHFKRYFAAVLFQGVASTSHAYKEFGDRQESVSQARTIDQMLYQTWKDHPRFRYIPHTTWTEKTKRADAVFDELERAYHEGWSSPHSMNVAWEDRILRFPTVAAWNYSIPEQCRFYSEESSCPLSMDINLTSDCQSSCLYCYTNRGTIGSKSTNVEDRFGLRPMSLPRLREKDVPEMISQFADLGGRTVFICSEGEPLIDIPSFISLAETAVSSGLNVVTYTNMLSLTPAVLRTLAAMKISLVLKLEHLDPGLNNRLINPGIPYKYVSFMGEKAPEQILWAIEAYHDQADRLAIGSMINNLNLDNLLNLRKWCYRTLGIAHFVKKLQYFGFAAKNQDQLEPDRMRMEFFERQLKHFDARFGYDYPEDVPDRYSYDIRRYLNNATSLNGFPIRLFIHPRFGFYESSEVVRPKFNGKNGVLASAITPDGLIDMKRLFSTIHQHTTRAQQQMHRFVSHGEKA